MPSASLKIRHFDSIEEIIAIFEESAVAGDLRNHFHLDGIEYLWTKEGILIPSITSPFSSPYLYRGQTERYPSCLPGVFRGLTQVRRPEDLPAADRARCLVDRIRLEEFSLALRMHPASAYADEIGLHMLPHALAQHYELATDRIDLTQDHLVAAFFATNTRKAGTWLPVSDGVGVIYRLHMSSFQQHFQERLEHIGKQALPRPGEQKAATLTLQFGLDFEDLPIEIYTFRQVESLSKHFNDHFHGGTSLFPPDVMTEIADAIRLEPSVPKRLVNAILGERTTEVSPMAEILGWNTRLLEEHSNVRVSERNVIAMTSLQNAEALDSVRHMRSTFLDNVGALAVRRNPARP